jgi:hypothetical protein
MKCFAVPQRTVDYRCPTTSVKAAVSEFSGFFDFRAARGSAPVPDGFARPRRRGSAAARALLTRFRCCPIACVKWTSRMAARLGRDACCPLSSWPSPRCPAPNSDARRRTRRGGPDVLRDRTSFAPGGSTAGREPRPLAAGADEPGGGPTHGWRPATRCSAPGDHAGSRPCRSRCCATSGSGGRSPREVLAGSPRPGSFASSNRGDRDRVPRIRLRSPRTPETAWGRPGRNGRTDWLASGLDRANGRMVNLLRLDPHRPEPMGRGLHVVSDGTPLRPLGGRDRITSEVKRPSHALHADAPRPPG